MACGIFALLQIFPFARNENSVAWAIGMFLAWTALGASWLVRIAPRLDEPPRWLMRRWSPLDWGLIAIILGCAAAAVA